MCQTKLNRSFFSICGLMLNFIIDYTHAISQSHFTNCTFDICSVPSSQIHSWIFPECPTSARHCPTHQGYSSKGIERPRFSWVLHSCCGKWRLSYTLVEGKFYIGSYRKDTNYIWTHLFFKNPKYFLLVGKLWLRMTQNGTNNTLLFCNCTEFCRAKH